MKYIIGDELIFSTILILFNFFNYQIKINKNKFKKLGQIRIGGQEHFYLETHNCVAIPGEGDEMQIISSTQGVNDVQVDYYLHIKMIKTQLFFFY